MFVEYCHVYVGLIFLCLCCLNIVCCAGWILSCLYWFELLCLWWLNIFMFMVT